MEVTESKEQGQPHLGPVEMEAVLLGALARLLCLAAVAVAVLLYFGKE
jgi:hypothetical protein